MLYYVQTSYFSPKRGEESFFFITFAAAKKQHYYVFNQG